MFTMDDATAPSPSGNPGFTGPLHKQDPRFDPYAFPADDYVPSARNISSYLNSASLHLPLHPKTHLPPGNPSPQVKFPSEKDVEPSYQSQFSAYLHSPTQGAYPTAQNGQQFAHPSSKLGNNSVGLTADTMHSLTQLNLQPYKSENQVSLCHSDVSQQTDFKPVKPKKKKKQKSVETVGVSKTTKKPKESKEVTPSCPVDVFPVSNQLPHSDFTREPKVLCAKNAAPILPASIPPRDGNHAAFFHSVQGSGSITTPCTSCPTTTTATTFTNSIHFLPDNRRQSTDSVELSTSRPASRTSTMSSSSSNPEGKTKEAIESVSMLKILEIIEREKSLGSSSPCKRRRTAKPQHIQEAEEEAKKYAASSAVQDVISGAAPSENCNSNKMSEQKNNSTENQHVPAVSPQGKQEEQSEVGQTVSHPNFQAVNAQLLSSSLEGLPVHSDNVNHVSNCGSNTPVFNKATPHSVVEARHDNSAAKTSERIVPQISKGSVKVNGNFIKPPVFENTHSISPHPPHSTGMLITSSKQPEPVDPETLKHNIQQHDHVMLEQKIFNSLGTASVPLPAAVQSGSSNLPSTIQGTIQNLLHMSSSPSNQAQLVNGSHYKAPCSMEAVLPGPDSFFDVKVQDLEPSLTCDLNNAWSQTADTISGNDLLLPQPPSVLQAPTSTPKKPKKKKSTNKPKVPQSHPSSDNSLSDAPPSSGTLPPFGAFAGLEAACPSFGFIQNEVHPQQLNTHSNSFMSNVVKTPSNKKKTKKSSSVLPEPLRDNSNLKLVNNSDKNEIPASDGSCKLTNLSTNTDTHSFNPSIFGFSYSKPVPDLSITETVDIKPSNAGMKPGSNGIIDQRTAGNTVNNAKLDSNCFKVRWNDIGLKPALGGSSDLKNPVVMDNWKLTSQHTLDPSLKQTSGVVTNTKPEHCVKSTSGVECAGNVPAGCPRSAGDVSNRTKLGGGFAPNGAMPDISGTVFHRGGPTTKPPPSPTPKLEPSFAHNWSPEEELNDRLLNNKVESVPQCNCLGPNYEFNESVEGPFYTQLGAAKDVPGLRHIMEKRTGLNGNAIRIEKIHYTGKEGRSIEGCPIAKWIIRRSGPEEKYLCVARKRPGHFCETAYIVVVIVAWEGVTGQQADSLYGYLVSTLTKNGFETERRCGTNERKTCACQGVDLIRRGASFSFGCSWSMYFNGCKFARSHIARKFKLKDTSEEEVIEDHLQNLATKVGPLYKVVAPDAYRNQTHFEERAGMCRLGKEKGKPFSGVTACVDFCAHSHKDFHNMQNGSTVVVTLTKHRGLSKPEDEQLHVLPLYVMDNTDECGSIEGQMRKVEMGALEILHKYSMQARIRATPLKKPKRGAKKESPAKTTEVNTTPDSPSGVTGSAPGTPTTPVTPTKERDMSFLLSQDSSQSLPDGSLSGNSSSTMYTPEKRLDASHSSFVDRENSSASDDFMSQTFGPSEMYEKVWEYFYVNGTFPPPSYMDRWAAAQKQAMMNPQKGVTNNGATKGSNVNNIHQPSSVQHSLQAADISENHSSSNAQHQCPPGYQSFTPGIKTEAANSSDVDQEIINLTYKQNGNDLSNSSAREGHCVRVSSAHTPSRPQSININDCRTPGSRYASPLDLLTEAAAAMEAGVMEGVLSPSAAASSPQFASTPVAPHSRPPSQSSVPFSMGNCSASPDLMSSCLPRPHSSPGVHNNHSHPGSPFVSPKPCCDGTLAPPSCNDQSNSSTCKPVMQPNGSFVAPTLGQGPDEPTFTMIDPSVVRCEWQDNVQSFHDPGIGGVAIALTHGAVLFEVAKRELHATTALKNPNRYQPTRVSLVFYQHKNLNYYHHGYYEYERKLATQRKNRIEKLMKEGATAEEAEKAVKPGKKRKKKDAEEEEEKIDFAKTSAAQYKYMWDTSVRHGMTLTTDSIITRWIDPQPMVTGPYQRWV